MPRSTRWPGSRREDLALHPTVKPMALVADAFQDVTRRGDLVLDMFLGSGTSLIAAERCGRRFRGLDIDPAYVDVAIERWIAMTGGTPRLWRGKAVMSAVGPRRPPAASRFRKGESGNPKGGPRAAPHRPSAFDIVIDRTLTVTRNGKPREVTVEEALQHRTYQDAIAGSRAARREVLKMIAKREKWLGHEEAEAARPVEMLIEPTDPAMPMRRCCSSASPSRTGAGTIPRTGPAFAAAALGGPGGAEPTWPARLSARRFPRSSAARAMPNAALAARGRRMSKTRRLATASRPPPRASGRARAATRRGARGGASSPPYEAVLGQIVTIKESGGERRVTAAEAFLLYMAKRGLEGDGAAARSAMAAIEEARPARNGHGPGCSGPLVVSTVAAW